MKRTLALGAILLAGSLAVACGDDSTGGSGGTGATSNGGSGGNPTTGGAGGTGGGGAIPPKPELGAQIDRMARPAINTALDGAFALIDGGGNVVKSDDAVRAGQEDTYNADDQPNGWGTNYTDLFALNLGLLDALDTGLDLGSGPLTNEQACEDQPLSCGDINGTAIDCYATLAGVLANDVLWLKTDGTDCSAASPADLASGEGYLAVELSTLGFANADCGGRRPIDDVIERTYSLIAAGLLGGFDDGITAPAGLHPETFPYMAAPH
ncbi:MAG: hypothetical protein U0271_17775 [Polyangiaceae bacterium]